MECWGINISKKRIFTKSYPSFEERTKDIEILKDYLSVLGFKVKSLRGIRRNIIVGLHKRATIVRITIPFNKRWLKVEINGFRLPDTYRKKQFINLLIQLKFGERL